MSIGWIERNSKQCFATKRRKVKEEDHPEEEKSKQISWTHALREIVINCYKFHGRDDLLPKFTEEEEVKRVPVARKVRGRARRYELLSNN